MFHYTRHVTDYILELGSSGMLHYATDLARLLDCDDFQLKTDPDDYNLHAAREKVFDRYCAACAKADVVLPPLEKSLVDAAIPSEPVAEDLAMIASLVTHLSSLGDGVPTAVRAYAATLSVFQCAIRKRTVIDTKNLLALINNCLMSAGLSPFRPRYDPADIGRGPDMPQPARVMRILIVDCDLGSILDTASALAGWRNIQTVWRRFPLSTYFRQIFSDTDSLVAAMIGDKPMADVVLLGHGLALFRNNGKLDKSMRDLLPDALIVSRLGDDYATCGHVASDREKEADILKDIEAALSALR